MTATTTTPLAAQVRLGAMLHTWKRLVRLESAALGEGDVERAERLQVRADRLAADHSALVRRVWAGREPL